MLGNNFDGYGLFHSCNITSLYLGRNISYADYREESGDVPLTARAFYGMDLLSISLGSSLNKTEILWGELCGVIKIFSFNLDPPSLLNVSEGAFTANQYCVASVFVPAELWSLTKLIQIGDILYTCKKSACLISPQYRRLQNLV